VVTREIDDACLGGALLFLHGHAVALTGKRWSGSTNLSPYRGLCLWDLSPIRPRGGVHGDEWGNRI